MDPTTKTEGHAMRALINNLLCARLEWTETSVSAEMPNDLRSKSRAFFATYKGTIYTVELTRCISLYRTCGETRFLLASSDSVDVRAELVGLYRNAIKSFYDWTSCEIDRYERQELGNIVTVRDLLTLVDHKKLAADYADERAYIALNDGKIKRTEEILSYRNNEYVKALQMIKNIVKCSKESNAILKVDDNDSSVLNWRVAIPADFPAVKTDLHMRVCPAYHIADADGDQNRETAVKIAALIILLSVMEQSSN